MFFGMKTPRQFLLLLLVSGLALVLSTNGGALRINGIEIKNYRHQAGTYQETYVHW